jgi:hypothetical protein
MEYTMKRFFTNRRTVLILLLLVTTCICVVVFVPQQMGPQYAVWKAVNPRIAGLMAALGLDRIFATWWFLVIAALFLVSLCYSTYDQYRVALSKTLREGRLSHAAEFELTVNSAAFIAGIRRLGYRELPGQKTSPGARRFVKSPWGYWGNFLLHLGLATSILFALVYVATEHRVIVRVIAGEKIALTPENIAERKGILAGSLPLPEAITLTAVTPTFWNDDSIKSLTSHGIFFAKGGGVEPYAVGINNKLSYRGMLVYQKNEFGTAFSIEMSDQSGNVSPALLVLSHPAKKDKAVYGDLPLNSKDYQLKVKYYSDAARRTVMPVNPQLTLRLLERGNVRAEVSLSPGQSAVVGPYVISLKKAGWWTEYLFEGSHGTAGIFTGFAFILLGVLLTYFAIPYVVIITANGAEHTISWQSQRFNDFFRAERDRVFALAHLEDVP